MTLDEMLAREAIRATLAKCAQAGDSLRGHDYAACFTEHGILETFDEDGEPGLHFEGRAAIFAWQNAWRDNPPTRSHAPGPRFVRHNLTSCKIELTGPDAANARTYWLVMTDIGPDHCGVYTDSFCQEDGDWLLAHRKVKTEWRAAQSHFRSLKP